MSRRGPARRRSGMTLLLGALVAALAYVNWQVVELEIDISPAAAGVAPMEPFAPPVLEPPLEPQPLSAFDEIVRRPLFTATRRPPEEPQESAEEVAGTAAGAASQPALQEFQLVGIAMDGRTRQALLRTPGEGEDWVREGESVGGWRLEKVGADGVVLGSGEQRQELSLYPARDAAAAGP